MHAPAPVMPWMGRNVDTFGFHIRVAQAFVNAHPILPGQYAKQGRTFQVIEYDVFAKPSGSR